MFTFQSKLLSFEETFAIYKIICCRDFIFGVLIVGISKILTVDSFFPSESKSLNIQARNEQFHSLRNSYEDYAVSNLSLAILLSIQGNATNRDAQITLISLKGKPRRGRNKKMSRILCKVGQSNATYWSLSSTISREPNGEEYRIILKTKLTLLSFPVFKSIQESCIQSWL